MKSKIPHSTSPDSAFGWDHSYQDEFWANKENKRKPYSSEGKKYYSYKAIKA